MQSGIAPQAMVRGGQVAPVVVMVLVAQFEKAASEGGAVVVDFENREAAGDEEGAGGEEYSESDLEQSGGGEGVEVWCSEVKVENIPLGVMVETFKLPDPEVPVLLEIVGAEVVVGSFPP